MPVTTRYSNIPGGDAFVRHLNSCPKPIRPVKSQRKASEMEAARFSVAYDGDSPAVRCALEDLHRATARLKGATLPLHLACGNLPGRSRKHSLEVGEGGVRIQAETTFGLARAIRRLTARLALRRAPFLERGCWTEDGTLDPALAHPALKESSLFTLEWPHAYQPGYLRRIAAAGYTGFHLNVCLYAFCRSKICPELDAPEGDSFLRELANITQAAEEVGLDVYLSLYLHPLRGDHPVFLAHPEMRGSRMVASDTHYVPCCSSPTSLSFYAEQMRRLFTAVPKLGGILALAGCEGWLHCFTANAPDSCPNCTGKQREPLVAHMYNIMAAAVKDTSPYARFIVWTYGLFAWTDNGGAEFIRHLRSPVEVMANFDTGEDFRLCGATGTRFDYSLSCVGPSRPFLAQKAAAKAGGLVFHAKCESGAPLEFCSLEHIPAITRWCRKYAGVLEHAEGALFNWKFLGFNGGLAQEAAGLYAMGEGKDLPRRLAIRDFGLAHANEVLLAWREFDRAMSYHPFSNQSAGYFKGPFFIGPAQPLFLEEPREVPDCFLNPAGHRPIWMTNLRFAIPFGVPAMLRALDKMLAHWSKGCACLEKVGGRHAALASLFLTFLRTARNMTRFFALRDSLWAGPLSLERHHQVTAELAAIARQELTNAREARGILADYPDLSFSVTYRHGICLENLDWKIAHTERLLAKELPMQDYGFTFSRNRTPVWNG